MPEYTVEKRKLVAIATAILTASLLASSAGAQQEVLSELLGDRLPMLDYNSEGLPDSSLLDLSGMLERPTGNRGFLFAGRDGNFYFEDGTRGRFWGINVAKDAVFQSPERIEEAVERIARAGFNLVRLHHVDDVEGLLPAERAGNEERIDPEALAAIDHWVAECGRRGIYVYLDLLDFRTFYESEGVRNGEELGRGAKPYAVFNERLIELQMQYAKAFLIDHVNHRTGLSYANDPTVVMIELCDEHGLFAAQRRRTQLISPYREELQRRWNYWLRSRYGDTESLRMAWTDWQGHCALGSDETLEDGTVTLHGDAAEPGQIARRVGTGTRGAGRINDLSQFMASVHRDYFMQMRDFLRERGLRVPITAVTDFESIPDLRSVYETLDFIGSNYYWDHPILRDGQWHLPMYFINDSPLGDPTRSFAPVAALSTIHRKPIVLREWGVCWPNKFRAGGMLEVISYAAHQDIDAMIMFTYDTRPERRRLDFFDVSRDPTRWGLAAIGARVFLERDVARAQRHIHVGYSEVDSYFRDGDRSLAQLYRASHVSAIRGHFFDEVFDEEVDLMVASGRSSGAVYAGDRTVISAEQRAEDLLNQRRQTTLAEKAGYTIGTTPPGRVAFNWGGTILPAGARDERATHPGFSLSEIESNDQYRPIGRGGDGRRAFGVRDLRRNNWIFHTLEGEDKLRATLDAFGQLYDERISHEYVDSNRFISDTREIVRDEGRELLVINTPTFQVIAGALQHSHQATGRMAARSETPIGAICWLSLDGLGPEESRRWLLKMVSIALNTDEEKSLHARERDRSIFAIDAPGDGPVITRGEPDRAGTTVDLGGERFAHVGLVNGTWEIVRDDGEFHVYCDTPGAFIEIPGAGEIAVAYTADGEVSEIEYDGTLTWPENTYMVTIR